MLNSLIPRMAKPSTHFQIFKAQRKFILYNLQRRPIISNCSVNCDGNIWSLLISAKASRIFATKHNSGSSSLKFGELCFELDFILKFFLSYSCCFAVFSVALGPTHFLAWAQSITTVVRKLLNVASFNLKRWSSLI